ncbi:TRAP transporter small permease [Halobacillus sp. Marseille-P3879]|uniref:TRAP transporter small permease n=1 Tax=Halobacillus TaxID=45667 RepID=UPI000C7C8BA5|nr:TRAP transporter small permease [Halobacillus sp. Marseille-P3879]
MKFFRILDKVVLKIEEFILGYAVIIIALMVVGNALSRAIFSYSLSFANEISQIAVIVATFMGISYAARKGRHISMSAFYDLAPFKVRKVVSTVIPFLVAVVLFVLAYYSYLYVMNVRDSGTVTSALQMPAYIIYIAIPLGFFLGGIQFLRNMIINIVRREHVYLGTDAKDYNDQDKTEIDEAAHL